MYTILNPIYNIFSRACYSIVIQKNIFVHNFLMQNEDNLLFILIQLLKDKIYAN